MITTVAKKVGGPKNFIGILICTGAVAGIGGTLGFQQLEKKFKRTDKSMREYKSYKIIKNFNNETLSLNLGDEFKVLNIDKDAVLIEMLHDDNNPHFVSLGLLKEISDYA